MTNLIVGKKGSGKTKKLVALANNAIEKSTGNVVVIEKSLKLTFDVNHKARLINIDNYSINNFEALYGFICGICSANYDISDIFIDSVLKIAEYDSNKLTEFIEKLNKLYEKSHTQLTLLISADENELPSNIKTIAHLL